MKERKFYACLEENGTSYSKLISETSEKCENQVKEYCGKSFICNRDLIYKLCVRTSSEECKYLYFASSLENIGSFEWKFERMKEEISFYLANHYSRPMKIGFVWLVSIPLAMLFLPRIFFSILKWLRN